MKIESKDTDVESLLVGSYFHIPRFQRPYSWDDENLNDFWDDVIVNQSDDYFIGSMVVYRKDKQQYGVVDGQQRLTTITILLCVIRDYFLRNGSQDLAEGVHQLVERKDRSNKNEYVLKTETSFPYFQEYIQKFNEDPELNIDIQLEERNLKNAHNRFNKLVGSVVNSIDQDASIKPEYKIDLKVEKLVNLRDAVLNLNLIFITLDNEDDAYLIFETLNTRGKDLALTDLVKNHFSKNLKTKGDVDHTKIKWSSMLDTIHNSSSDISSDNFIYHFWSSRYEAVPLKKLFPKIKKDISKSKAKDYLDALVSDSKIYRSIHEENFEWSKNESDVSDSLYALQLFKLSQPTPATMSLVRSYKDKIIKYKKLRDTLSAIEKFHFVFTAITSSRSSGGISAMYSSFAIKLFNCSESQAASDLISEFVTKLRDKRPSIDEFKVAFREVVYTNKNSKQKNLVRYILEKFSLHYSYKYPVDFDDLTIEHLCPQEKIGQGEWLESSVGCLGNLFFLDQKMNGELDAKSFADKKKILRERGYSLSEFVANSNSWTPDLILKHADKMAEVAYSEIWKI
ncbi:DUF262 domain-containing HNH endonuclease family protein [Simiduia curdlanivorans]|uniref:DUF262 domain-containing protein n=1 Tax=Simiduia curdlanivorans TaxID=1492769 RepID=A0ABV8VAU7_9GAMM|nr:DUF262 domain-containing HNH endonuclease family protein [Simiduia curdlanivorans]MDN3639478.1 DUF262 domain-containing HNH endonuclease family protein [Simiduia curdlanivorans]